MFKFVRSLYYWSLSPKYESCRLYVYCTIYVSLLQQNILYCSIFKKTNGNMHSVFIIKCNKGHDPLKEIIENLIKDLKIIREIMFISVQWSLNCWRELKYSNNFNNFFHIHHEQLTPPLPKKKITIKFLLSLMGFLLYNC